MSLISSFIHYNIFRNMSDSKTNESEQPEPKKKEETLVKFEPDIEMGISQNQNQNVNHNTDPKNISKCPVKKGLQPDYWWV